MKFIGIRKGIILKIWIHSSLSKYTNDTKVHAIKIFLL